MDTTDQLGTDRTTAAIVAEARENAAKRERYVAVNGGTPASGDLWLIEDTHRDNELAWFEEGCSEEQVREIARRANLGEITL
jgi:hypothetical protein